VRDKGDLDTETSTAGTKKQERKGSSWKTVIWVGVVGDGRQPME
jgi:hypothetical protein